jgi:hypothetical protein
MSEFDITTFNQIFLQNITIYSQVLKLSWIFKSNILSQPMFYSVGGHASNNWEMNSLVSVSFSRYPNPCLVNLLSPITPNVTTTCVNLRGFFPSGYRMTATCVELHGFRGLYESRLGRGLPKMVMCTIYFDHQCQVQVYSYFLLLDMKFCIKITSTNSVRLA